MSQNSSDEIKLSSLEAQIVSNLRRIDQEKRMELLLVTRAFVQHFPVRPALRLVHSSS